MKIIKISSIACPSCIIMNNTLKKLKESYELNIKEIDYDFDEFDYEVGNILPVLIFEDENGNELSRLIGEKSYNIVEEEIKKYM